MADAAEEPRVPNHNDHRGVGRHAESWSDRALVDAMRRGEAAAFREFYMRFAPALRRLAHRHRAVLGDIDGTVTDTLTDGAMALLPYTVPVPRSLAAYLTTALRNHIGTVRRTNLRRERRDAAAASVGERLDSTEATPVATSEATWRAGAGPAWDDLPTSPTLLRLIQHLETGLIPTERAMLVWLAHYVPQRTIAEWLGLSYDVAAKRATRLRARLRSAAVRYAESLPDDERRELHHFFRRAAGATTDGGVATADPTVQGSVRRATRTR